MSGRIFLASQIVPVADLLIKSIGDEPQKVAFITTAAEPEEDAGTWLPAERDALSQVAHWQIFDYSITGKSYSDLQKDLADTDILYVAGGNVFYLLKQAQTNDFGEFVRAHVASGKIYIGQSAGSIVAGPDTAPLRRADKIAVTGELDDYRGFGLVDFIPVPHWGRPDKRTLYFEERLPLLFSEKYKLIPLTDKQYVAVGDNGLRVIDADD